MAEADTSHHMKKEYRQEVPPQLQINAEEAQIIIQQAQRQTQQETQTHFTNFVGRIIEFSEHQYRKERQQTKQAQKDAGDAKKRAKTSEKSEHNIEPKNERTPENRAKPKQELHLNS